MFFSAIYLSQMANFCDDLKKLTFTDVLQKYLTADVKFVDDVDVARKVDGDTDLHLAVR